MWCRADVRLWHACHFFYISPLCDVAQTSDCGMLVIYFWYKPFMWCRSDIRLWHSCYLNFDISPLCGVAPTPDWGMSFISYLSRRRFRHPIGLLLILLGFREDYRPTSSSLLSAVQIFIPVVYYDFCSCASWLHLLYLMFNCLRVHSKYSLACPWLLSWPDFLLGEERNDDSPGT